MTWIDIVLAAIIVLFLVRGVLRGLLREGFGLAGVLIGLIVAINRYDALGIAISREVTVLSDLTARIIAFVVIFVGIALLGALTGIWVHNALHRYSTIRGIDEAGGFVLGMFEGVMICSILLVLLSISPLAAQFSTWSRNSFLKPRLESAGPLIYDRVVSLVHGDAKKFMERLDPFRLP